MLAILALSLYWVHLGFGKHMNEVATSTPDIMIVIYIMQPIFVVAMLLIKTSALLFYVRVFQFANLFAGVRIECDQGIDHRAGSGETEKCR